VLGTVVAGVVGAEMVSGDWLDAVGPDVLDEGIVVWTLVIVDENEG
jgi:hypothetical protein